MKAKSISRREFITKSSLVAAGASFGVPAVSGMGRRAGPNDRIRLGFIGVGNRGTDLLKLSMENPDVEVAALCDVYEPYLNRNRSSVIQRYFDTGKVPLMDEGLGSSVKRYTDFRKMLEQKDIEAIFIATPDHWHAIQAIMSMDAGKDVYVEKPLTITLKEGRAIVEAEKRTSRIGAVGLNRRGCSIYQKLSKEFQGGKIGKVTSARAFRISNMFPDGIGRLKPEDPPPGFNWDMWLGPRPYRLYQYNIAPYYFRWWKEYSSQMGNWGVHYMDVIRWLIGEKAPVAITAHGGKYVVKDDRDIPDTMEVFFEHESGVIIQFSIHEASGGEGIPGGEIELKGTLGTLVAREDGYRITPSSPGQFQTWEKRMEEEKYEFKGETGDDDYQTSENSTGNLIRNFLDCVKSREKPLCSLEDGHRSTSFAHLANISLEMGMRIEWDAVNEKITNSEKANELLHYEYRKPWKL
ncbi:MAG: oxidoreductase [Bacteroides sp. SM23_62_1]|nr:MAG: oxidoreductase [Bacteroides sp. SM23_62_1]